MRTTAILAALLGAVVFAAPARAALVYVKQPGTTASTVYVARDDGTNPRRLGSGRAPTISPDGRWVAFVTPPAAGSAREAVVLQKLRSGSRRLVLSARSVASLEFSPDSRRLASIVNGTRVRVHDIARGRLHDAARGHIRGYAFSPDSDRIVVGNATGRRPQAASDLYVGSADGRGRLERLTTVGNAVNPVWGSREVLFDRFRRRSGDAPAFNLWAVDPAARSTLRRLTRLTIPPLASGLVPLEVSADGRRMLAVFTGQDTQVGFTVRTAGGRTRALSSDFATGLVGFDLSADGRTILAHTGGADPQARHDVVVVPFGREGRPRVLVADAAYPDWNR